jgi:hypothetical protein
MSPALAGIAPHVERLVLAEQVTIALADLATAVRDGLVESDAEGGRMMALTCGRAEGICTPDPLHAMQFRPPHPSQVRDGRQPTGLLEVTVTVRWIPLVPAACGTRVARPVRTTMAAPAATASPRPEGEARARRPLLRWQEPEGITGGMQSGEGRAVLNSSRTRTHD